MSGVKRGQHHAGYLSYRSTEDINRRKDMEHLNDLHCVINFAGRKFVQRYCICK